MANMGSRILTALRWLRAALTPAPIAWNGAALALFAFWLLLYVAFFATGVAPHFTIGSTLGLAALIALLAAASAALFLLFQLVAMLAPRYRAVFLLILPPTALLLLASWYVKGGLIGTAVVILALSLTFGAGASLLTSSTRRADTWLFLAAGVTITIVCAFLFIRQADDPNPTLAGYHLRGHTLAMPDPGRAGPYKVTRFTYGSGRDRYRTEYAKGARIVSRTVDASKLDEQWTGVSGWVRTLYWGFDPHAFPVQGRVWMPADAKGPAPLVLIVHGNHLMEDHSDPGYAYLGELLASQGFIAVSVDENFLNSSIADLINPFSMRQGSETRVRGWLLLEHLVQWREWNKDPRNPVFGKVDIDRIALIGHSRGGEAVAVANAFNTLGHYPDDATLPFNFRFNLRGIAAIAPADGQYSPRARPTPMQDTNYFTIHGSMDGDVTSFMGSSQYSRATFSPGSTAFKASVYVKDANHGQFNTSWGRNDLGGSPIAYLIDERSIMNPDAQRQIAKVYLSAFLQMTLMDKRGYGPLFEDARNGTAWLPDDYIINNYADGETQWLARYEEDLDPSTGSTPGVTIDGHNLSIWRETYIKLKDATLDSQVAVLAWDDRVHAKGATYTMHLPLNATTAGANLVLGLSNANIDTLPEDFQGEKGKQDPQAGKNPLNWHIVLVDANGQTARLPLSDDQLLYPQMKSITRRIPEISGLVTSEVVMRRYCFPLKNFAAKNPALDVAHLRSIRFDFDMTARGAIALDDVGLATPK